VRRTNVAPSAAVGTWGEYSYEERASESHTLVARGRERRKGGQVDDLIGIVAEGAIPASQRKWYLSASMFSSLRIISLFVIYLYK
jgi:hypothetical protein